MGAREWAVSSTTDIAASLAGRKLGKHDLLVVLIPEALSIEASIALETKSEEAAKRAGCGLMMLRQNESGVHVLRRADFVQLSEHGVEIRVHEEPVREIIEKAVKWRKMLERLSTYLGRLASQSDHEAAEYRGRHGSLAEACEKDAANWRATKASIDKVIGGGA